MAKKKEAKEDVAVPRGKVRREKTTRERRVEAVKKTTVPAIVGAVVGVVSGMTVGVASGLFVPFLFLVGVSVYIQKFIFPYVGVDLRDLEMKDWAYIAFITFDSLLITWTMYLNAPHP